MAEARRWVLSGEDRKRNQGGYRINAKGPIITPVPSADVTVVDRDEFLAEVVEKLRERAGDKNASEYRQGYHGAADWLERTYRD